MANNAFYYLDNFQNKSVQDLTFLPSKNGKSIRYPASLGSGATTLPFTLFLPYRRNQMGITDGFLSTNRFLSNLTGDALYEQLPEPEFAIALPTPASALKNTVTAEYGQVEVGQAVGAAMSGGLEAAIGAGAAAAIGARVARSGGAVIGGALGAQLMGSGLDGTALMGLQTALETVQLPPEIANIAAAKADNPYTETLFKNIAPRSHSFSYTFMPKDVSESRIIDSIIGIFRYAMLPRPAMGGFFEFPYEFQIVHSVASTTFVLMPSVLKSFDVDYGGGGDSPKLTKLVDGQQYPAKITMSMTFDEVILLNRDRLVFGAGLTDDGAPAQGTVKRYRF